MKCVGLEVGSEIKIQPFNLSKDQVTDEIWYQVIDKVWDQVWLQVRDQVLTNLW